MKKYFKVSCDMGVLIRPTSISFFSFFNFLICIFSSLFELCIILFCYMSLLGLQERSTVTFLNIHVSA